MVVFALPSISTEGVPSQSLFFRPGLAVFYLGLALQVATLRTASNLLFVGLTLQLKEFYSRTTLKPLFPRERLLFPHLFFPVVVRDLSDVQPTCLIAAFLRGLSKCLDRDFKAPPSLCRCDYCVVYLSFQSDVYW